MRFDPAIKLLISIRDPASQAYDADVVAELATDTRIEELSHALASHLQAFEGDPTASRPAEAPALHCVRLGRLAPSERVMDSGLRSGDVVALTASIHVAAPTPARPAAAAPSTPGGIVNLIVNAGPQAGRRVSLRPGRYLLGRGTNCDIVLDDPSLSRRHLEVEVGSETVGIRDVGSLNGSAVEGRVLVEDLRLAPDDGSQIEVGRSVITFSRATLHVAAAGTTRDGSTPFNRPPRIVERHDAPRLRLEGAPPEAIRVKLQIGAAVVPLVLGGAFAAALEQPALLLSMLLSPATLLCSYVSERRRGRLLFRQSTARYDRQLETLAGELESARVQECAARRAAAPDAAEIAARALEIRSELWERRPADEDFLSLRVGVADLSAELTVETPAIEDRPLPPRAQDLLDAYRTVPMVPVVLDLERVGSLGLAGPESRVDGLGLWLALQAAVLHSPRELSIAAAVDPDQREHWDWLKWLPHTRTDPSPIGGSQLVDDVPATEDLLSRLSELVDARQRMISGHSGANPTPALVLFLDEDLIDERATVNEILARGPAVGVHTVWLGHTQRGLPGECRSIAVLDATVARLKFILVSGAQQIADIAADAMPADLALEIARSLASLEDIGASGGHRRSVAGAGRQVPISDQVADDSARNAAPTTPHTVTIIPFGWSSASIGSFMQDRSAS